jgi:hypothetical protein
VLTLSITVFYTPITINGRRLYIIIDSRASGNFISIVIVTRFRIATKSKDYRYKLVAIDGLALPSVIEETLAIELVI